MAWFKPNGDDFDPTDRGTRVSGHRTPKADVDSAGLASALRKQIEGEVCFDGVSRALYAADSSNYRQVPIGVVVPKSVNDLILALSTCREFGAPVFSRGAGTSLAGQCCNVAVVIEWSKYLHRILEINPQDRWARVEPGTVCDDLRRAAEPHGLTWGPDPATHSYCTFGGMLGNNSCGVHSQVAGKSEENVIGMEILLYNGTRMSVGWMRPGEMDREIQKGGRTGEIYAKLKGLTSRYSTLIRERFPKIPRRVSGYNLDQLLPGPDGRFNVARALVGSESTCATTLEAAVQLVHIPAHRALVVLGYPDIYKAADFVPEIVRFRPVGMEGFDEVTTGNIRKKSLAQCAYLPSLPEGKGWLLVEFAGDTPEEAVERARFFLDSQAKYGNPSVRTYEDPVEQRHIWSLRESGLGANAFVPGEAPTWEGWEDSSVSPERLGEYLRDLQKLYDRYRYKSALYGHFGQGCVHYRVNFDLQSSAGVGKWRAFMEEATDLVAGYGGSLSGEHGDGQARGEFLYKMYGRELVQAFREFKSIWDPDGMMNPGKIVDAYAIDESLRMRVAQLTDIAQTHFSFRTDGGSFDQAVGRCVGVGKCRRVRGDAEHGTMCPSYMVTREEKHSTRGRAHLLWEMLRGEAVRDGWRDAGVKEALDLCLACKACKSECPVNVDMATYKAEFLSHYWEGRLRPLHAYVFGWIDKWARLAALAPSFANAFTHMPLVRDLVHLFLDVARERRIPAFASQTFRHWFTNRLPGSPGGPKVLLWPDTFNNYFKPETAKAAVEVLESAGYQVEIPARQLCCGRPLYDQGFLDMARSYLLRVVRGLRAQIEVGTPVIVLEPSCFLFFAMRCVACCLICLRLKHSRSRPSRSPSSSRSKPITIEFPSSLERRSCKATATRTQSFASETTKRSCGKMDMEYRVLQSGCCGMAGAFGYEKEKYGVSIACAERVLLPEVRNALPSTLILADGFSCREQIEQSTGRSALHLAEALLLALRTRASEIEYPEHAI